MSGEGSKGGFFSRVVSWLRRLAARLRSVLSARHALAMEDWFGTVRRPGRRSLAGLVEEEWDALIGILRLAGRHDDLWALVFQAPPSWSAEILAILQEERYQPAGDLQTSLFRELCALRPPQGRLLYLPSLWQTLAGHQGNVWALAFSADGSLLATGSEDGTVRLWDVDRGKPEGVLADHDDLILTPRFSPDGRILATESCRDAEVWLWDVDAGERRATLGGHEAAVMQMEFSPDGRLLATGGGWMEQVRLWDVASGRLRTTLEGHGGPVRAIAFAPDGGFIATAGLDRVVALWNPQSGELVGALQGHAAGILALACSPDGRLLASGSRDRSVRLWEVTASREIARLQGHGATVVGMLFSPGGDQLLTQDEASQVCLWEAAGATRTATLPPRGNVAVQIGFAPDRRAWAAEMRPHETRLWDVARGEPRAVLPGTPLAATPDNRTVATGGRDGIARVWDVFGALPVTAFKSADLDWLQEAHEETADPAIARAWRFLSHLLAYRLAHEQRLAAIARQVLAEFDVALET